MHKQLTTFVVQASERIVETLLITTEDTESISPLFYRKDGSLVCGTILRQREVINWSANLAKGETRLEAETNPISRILVNYPFMAYLSPLSDNRELILVNMADKEQP